MAAAAAVRVRIQVDDEHEAREIAAVLRVAGATRVGRLRHEGSLPVVGTVVMADAPVDTLAAVAQRWRAAHGCRETLDCRDGAVRLTKDSSRQDGSIVVVAADRRLVYVTDVPAAIDLTALATAALHEGADAVRRAAEAAGATASEPQPVGGGGTPASAA